MPHVDHNSCKLRTVHEIDSLASELLNSVKFMRVDAPKEEQAWKPRSYPVPTSTAGRARWKAKVLRTIHRLDRNVPGAAPVTVMVPALLNFMPGENVALGWFNEIESLLTIRQRMNSAARITGWDPFTFHTLHNADHFFDTTIDAMRETWLKEGSLSAATVREAKRRFGKPCHYYRIHARLIENLVFQSSLLDFVGTRATDLPLRVHVIGTALLSALVSAGSISFAAAVESANKFGSRWDEELRGTINGSSDAAIDWSQFRQVQSLIAGRGSLSTSVTRAELPTPDAPARPFWYSATATEEATLITTAQEAANALETLNIASWAYVPAKAIAHETEPIRGWLVSPLHPMARCCRWSFSNSLLATPTAVSLFLDHIATLGGRPIVPANDALQKRLRLSRMKVTGP